MKEENNVKKLSVSDVIRLLEITRWYRKQIEAHGLPDRKAYREFCQKMEKQFLIS